MKLRYLRLWAELLRLCLRLRRGQSVAMLVVLALSTLLAPISALALRDTVNAIIEHDPSRAGLAGVIAAVSFALASLLHSGSWMISALVVEQLSIAHLQRQIHADLTALEGLDHLERTDFLDRVTVLDGAAWDLLRGMWEAIGAAFNLVKIALLLFLLGAVTPWLLLLLPVAGALLWFDQRGQQLVNAAETDTAEAFRLQRHLFNLATEPRGGKDIRVSDASEQIAARQSAAWDQAINRRFRARLEAAAWRVAGWALFTVAFVAGLWLVLYRASKGIGTVGDVVLAITIAVGLRDSIFFTVSSAGEAADSFRLIEPYLWLREYVAAARRQENGTAPTPSRLSSGIAFEQVSFCYPGTDRPALREVSFQLPAGCVVAIVGEYGSGKSTLVKLLAKFYRPDAGRISVDGIDLAELDTHRWRARSSAAFQDFGRFELRFGETVGLGDLPHLDDETHLRPALRAADAEQLVQRLPEQLATQLGRAYGGVELSEGQWQKTALARASMRAQPLLFLLDEPTASLDAPSEHTIFERYMARSRELAQRTGAITVIVSHRFSTVTGADQILVLDHGRLVENGTHENLLAAGGRYADLYTIQSTAYTLPTPLW